MVRQGAVPVLSRRTRMRGYSPVVVEDFNELLADFNGDLTTGEPVGHRVVVLGHFDVIVHIHPSIFPGGKDKWIGRQWLQLRLVSAFKQR